MAFSRSEIAPSTVAGSPTPPPFSRETSASAMDVDTPGRQSVTRSSISSSTEPDFQANSALPPKLARKLGPQDSGIYFFPENAQSAPPSSKPSTPRKSAPFDPVREAALSSNNASPSIPTAAGSPALAPSSSTTLAPTPPASVDNKEDKGKKPAGKKRKTTDGPPLVKKASSRVTAAQASGLQIAPGTSPLSAVTCPYVDPLTAHPCGERLGRTYDLPRHMIQHAEHEIDLITKGLIDSSRCKLHPQYYTIWIGADGREVPKLAGLKGRTCPKCQVVYSRPDAVQRHLPQCDGRPSKRQTVLKPNAATPSAPPSMPPHLTAPTASGNPPPTPSDSMNVHPTQMAYPVVSNGPPGAPPPLSYGHTSPPNPQMLPGPMTMHPAIPHQPGMTPHPSLMLHPSLVASVRSSMAMNPGATPVPSQTTSAPPP